MTTEQPPPSLASVTLDWAIAASQAATTGSVTEADLVEHVHARLVFNVGVGNNDVKVDASTGAVITAGLDD